MALTATMSLAPSTVQINEQSMVAITVSNSGSTVSLTSFQGVALSHADNTVVTRTFQAGNPFDGVGFSSSVPGSGSLLLLVPYVMFAPGSFDLSATILASDGSYVSVTPSTLTVNQVPFHDAP